MTLGGPGFNLRPLLLLIGIAGAVAAGVAVMLWWQGPNWSLLYGNLEASDIENLPADEFQVKVDRALQEGPGGRGFVLMPSSCPYGRVLSQQALRNYQVMVETIERGE